MRGGGKRGERGKRGGRSSRMMKGEGGWGYCFELSQLMFTLLFSFSFC